MSLARALALFALDPAGCGGAALRGRAGPAREAALARLRAMLPQDAPVRRLPASIDDSRLMGGLDLAATLSLGRPVALRGLLAEADCGVIVAPMAERLPPSLISRVAAAMDLGEARAERDGLSLAAPARFGLVALDEGVDDEILAEALRDRLAFHLACDAWREDEDEPAPDAQTLAQARTLAPRVRIDAQIIHDLAQAAEAFGIDSLRALSHAVRVARLNAALEGRIDADEDDARMAAALVLAPRARRLPPQEQEPEAQQPEDNQDSQPDQPPPQDADADRTPPPEGEDERAADAQRDVMAEAVRAALPADLLAQLLGGGLARVRTGASGRSAAARASKHRGRPIGARPGDPRSGARLALLDTLRAAAPMQTIRRRLTPQARAKILVRREDFRIMRFRESRRVATIFIVDASGSAALHRLAEAKGAVQHLLAECYVRRDEAALIAFRGRGAELLLPPTRSLARVRKSLTRLPGGGGTPLAAGVRLAQEVALQVARKGDAPVLVFLTDGQANVALDGAGDRVKADADAKASAQALRDCGYACLVVDTSPRPQPRAAAFAQALGARYLPLPAADAQRLSKAVQAAL
jgi:magnesium chelatase subunit D